MTVLDKVNYANDIKKLSIAELDTLADEMRQLIIKKVNFLSKIKKVVKT